MSSNKNTQVTLDSDVSLSRCPDIIINEPHPGEWVLVKQFNMETREPCEIWRSGVHNQIKKMQCQLTMVCKELQQLDKEIHQKLQSTTSSDDATDSRVGTEYDDTQHTDDHQQDNDN